MMDKLVLLTLISLGYLCDASRVHYNSDGFVVSGSDQSEEVIEDMPPCGEIMSSNSGQFRMERVTSSETDSKYIEFPWMVVMYTTVREHQQCSLTDSKCWPYYCVGSLIGPKVVLSNAACVDKYRQDLWKVRAGDWNLGTYEEPHPYQERFVKEVIVHPQYQYSKCGAVLRNDVALLVVESSFTIADNIAFICLPPPDLNLAAASCKATGWDHTNETTTGPSALSVEDASYIDHDQCPSTLGTSNWVMHDSYTCAAGAQREKPSLFNHQLLCIAENHYYARGLSSWGLNYNNASIYGYMDVVKFKKWIDQTMRANRFPTDTYTHNSYRKFMLHTDE